MNAMATPEPVIAFEGVTFSYGGAPALEDVNLRIEERDFAAVLGPNGGGKTTLLKLVLGLLRPDRGTVRVFGGPPSRARPRIGYVPQHSDCDLRFPVRVVDVVLTGRLGGPRWWGPYRRDDRDAAHNALNEVGLYGLRSRPFSALSGGQQQRVLIARALVAEPELLLLDEPTANVDIAAEEELYRLLEHLNERLTILLATHDVSFVPAYVKQAVCVKRHVVVHPTGKLTGELISEIFGTGLLAVQHDHLAGKGEG